MNRYFDNTMLSDYKTCPRYYYIRHVRGWRSQGTAMPLIFGLAWHSAMDVIWRGFGKFPDGVVVETAFAAFNETWAEEGATPFEEMDFMQQEGLGARTPMNAKQMMVNYIEKRRGILEQAKLIAAERPFAVPIFPDNAEIWYIGRRDKDIELNGEKIVIEHKTTSEYKKDGGFKTSYLESWYPNSQCEGYLYSSNIELGNVKYVWVDAALVHKTVHDAFRFIPISATFGNLDNWLWEARDWIERVLTEEQRLEGQPKERVVMGAFPRNTSSCSGKYGLCPYLDICRGYANPAVLDSPPAGYIYEPWHPFEILKIADLGMPDDRPELAK